MRVLISGGGTGGHIFPALAVARALTQRVPDIELLYIGRRGGMEEEIVPGLGLPLETLAIRGVQDDGWRNLPLLYAIPAAVLRATSLVRRFAPDVVFGTGGYVVGPVGAAASLVRRPLVLQLPDAVPGRTIRLLSRRARAVCVAFDASAARLPGANVVVTGTPLRPEFEAAAQKRRSGRQPQGLSLRRLAVIGGSQGARRINTALEEALKGLLELPGLTIHHVSGQLDYERLHAMRSGLSAEARERYTLEAFTPSLDTVLAGADLVISRAGGSTVAELTALGLPMVLVPYPHAGGHQRFNAEPAVRGGAAAVVPDEELSGVRLLSEVKRLSGEPGAARLRSMAAASLALGRPDAAERVADVVLDAA